MLTYVSFGSGYESKGGGGGGGGGGGETEAAPASTEGLGQTHEGRQRGAWLTIL